MNVFGQLADTQIEHVISVLLYAYRDHKDY